MVGTNIDLVSYHVLTYAGSKTAVRIPSRPSMRLRPRLAVNCANSGPITMPRFGDGSGPEVRNWATHTLAASVSSCHASVWKPLDSIASCVAAALRRKLVAGVRAHGTR